MNDKCPECNQVKDIGEWVQSGKCDECRYNEATCTVCGKQVETYIYITMKNGIETDRGHVECLKDE